MKTVVRIVLSLVALLVIAAGGIYAWATVTSDRLLARTFTSHSVDFAIPFPVSPEEAAELDATEDVQHELALERARERGRHLVEARYACTACHGENFGGGVMVDAFPIGTILGPNLTSGQGGRTEGYGPTEWDRIVRHGVLPDGRPAAMPSEDFRLMSDQELSDIVVFIRSLPPVDNVTPLPELGPLGRILVATGQLPLSADMIDSHESPHSEAPPATAASVEFGEHLAGVCMGCHRADLSGGPVPGGDPSWPPARNLTPAPSALGGWNYDDFVRAMRDALRPDGTPLLPPMNEMAPFAQRMTETEMEALWMYVRSVPPVPVAN